MRGVYSFPVFYNLALFGVTGSFFALRSASILTSSPVLLMARSRWRLASASMSRTRSTRWRGSRPSA
jgi:hypothetical protein